MRSLSAISAVVMLVFSGLPSAQAGTLDTSGCKREIAAAAASVGETLTHLKTLGGSSGASVCAAHRKQFLLVVRARAAVAACKTGSDLDQEVVRLDGAVEDVNSAIAANCAGI
jgi:hypothetical protein